MATDVFTTSASAGVVEATEPAEAHYLNTYCPNEQFFDTEEVVIDREEGAQRITPFVSPLVAGKVVDQEGYSTTTIKPAYAKDKRRVDPTAPLRRAIGERIGGTLAPAERVRRTFAHEQEDQRLMLTRREEVMAAEMLRTGKVTVSGEGFATVVVDYLRHASLSMVLAGASRWDQPNVDHLLHLEAWVMLAAYQGSGLQTITMHPGVWTVMRKRLIDLGYDLALFAVLRGNDSSEAEMGPVGADALVQRVARFGDSFEIVTDARVYVDDAGAVQPFMPAGTLVMASVPDLLGTRLYGAIRDPRAESGVRAGRYLQTDWVDEDPAVHWLLLQSAPLVVPFRPNASLAVKVF